MSMKRITISIPEYLHKTIDSTIPKGEVSGLVTKLLEKEMLTPKESPAEVFIKLRKKMPKMTTAKILRAIRKGRT